MPAYWNVREMGPRPWSSRLSETVTDNWDSVFGHTLAVTPQKEQAQLPLTSHGGRAPPSHTSGGPLTDVTSPVSHCPGPSAQSRRGKGSERWSDSPKVTQRQGLLTPGPGKTTGNQDS